MAFVERNVGVTGAGAGRILYGFARNNEGLRIRVLEAQPAGAQGPVQGRFVVLDAGRNRHMQALARLLHRTTDAAEVLGIVRRPHAATVNVVNRNVLALEVRRPYLLRRPAMEVEQPPRPDRTPEPAPEPTRPAPEPGNAPEGEPGNRWVTPEAERPPKRRKGVVSDPDF